jgi:excisionase family DNA binding protein
VDPPRKLEPQDAGEPGVRGRPRFGGVITTVGQTVSTTEAARQLGVSNSYVQQLLARGKLQGERVQGARAVWRVELESLEQFVLRRTEKKREADTQTPTRSSAYEYVSADASIGDSRAEMLELELVAARQELAELRSQLAEEKMVVDRLRAENRDLASKLSSVASAHVLVVQSLLPPEK